MSFPNTPFQMYVLLAAQFHCHINTLPKITQTQTQYREVASHMVVQREIGHVTEHGKCILGCQKDQIAQSISIVLDLLCPNPLKKLGSFCAVCTCLLDSTTGVNPSANIA